MYTYIHNIYEGTKSLRLGTWIWNLVPCFNWFEKNLGSTLLCLPDKRKARPVLPYPKFTWKDRVKPWLKYSIIGPGEMAQQLSPIYRDPSSIPCTYDAWLKTAYNCSSRNLLPSSTFKHRQVHRHTHALTPLRNKNKINLKVRNHRLLKYQVVFFPSPRQPFLIDSMGGEGIPVLNKIYWEMYEFSMSLLILTNRILIFEFAAANPQNESFMAFLSSRYWYILSKQSLYLIAAC